MSEAIAMKNLGETLESRLATARSVRAVRIGAMLLGDLIAISLAMVIALLGRSHLWFFDQAEGIPENVLPSVGLFMTLWILCLFVVGAYQLKRVGVGSGEYNAVLLASLLTAAISGVTAYLTSYDLSRGFYVLLVLVGTALLLLFRSLVRRLVHALHRADVFTTPVLLVGDPAHVDELASILRRATWLGYKLVGALTPPGNGETTPKGLTILGTVDAVVDTIRFTRARLVIFTEGAFPQAKAFNRLARQLEDEETQLVVVPALTDVSAARMSMRPVAGLPLVYVESPRAVMANRWAKRAFDIASSGLAILIATPVMGLVALAIKLEDGGPVLFPQVRAGRKGVPFTCYKFRSMVVDAEARRAQLTSDDRDNVLFKMKQDPRITRVGRFIRRFSLDELPQLLNVAKGDMSLVGPRPALLSEVAAYQEDVHRRLDVRPGLTGLWQVSGRSDLSWEDTVRLDLYYVDNWSLLQDLSILRRTLGAVLSSRGGY